MRYNGNGNIRKYIMKMFNLSSKLKTLDIEINENFVHLVLISHPAQFIQFKISYNIIKINGVLTSLSHNVYKKKIGLREKGEKVLIWQLTFIVRRKENLWML